MARRLDRRSELLGTTLVSALTQAVPMVHRTFERVHLSVSERRVGVAYEDNGALAPPRQIEVTDSDLRQHCITDPMTE